MLEKIAADEQPGQPVACYIEMRIHRPIQIVHRIEFPSRRLTSPRPEFPEKIERVDLFCLKKCAQSCIWLLPLSLMVSRPQKLVHLLACRDDNDQKLRPEIMRHPLQVP